MKNTFLSALIDDCQPKSNPRACLPLDLRRINWVAFDKLEEIKHNENLFPFGLGFELQSVYM